MELTKQQIEQVKQTEKHKVRLELFDRMRKDDAEFCQLLEELKKKTKGEWTLHEGNKKANQGQKEAK